MIADEIIKDDFKQVELKKLKIGITEFLDPHLLGDMKIDVSRQLAGHAEIRIEGFIWTQDLGKYSFPTSIPANWWESFKEGYFPRWLLERFPIQYKDFEVRITAWYPELHKKLAFPKEQYRIKVAKYDTDSSWR